MTLATRAPVGRRDPGAESRSLPPRWLFALERVWSLPLWAHTVVLVALVVAVAPFMRLDGGAWVEEEGRLGLQVEALDRGDWSYGYAGESFDAEGRWAPLAPAPVGSEQLVPAGQQPAHAMALAGAARVLGSGTGLYFLSLTGLVLGAVAAWLLAGEFEPRGSRAAFWLVAAGPLLVNAYVLWAYTLVAAVAGLALLAALQIMRSGPTWWRGVGLATTLGVGAVLSPESVLFAGALVVALTVVLGWRRRWSGALVGIAAGAVATAAFAAGQVWVGRIAGDRPGLGALWADSGGAGWADRLETRVAAAWRFVFDGGNVALDTERLVLVALVAALGGGLFLRMRGREGRFVGATVATGVAVGIVALFAIRFSNAPLLPVLGLLAAWPLAVLGLAAFPGRAMQPPERLMVAVALVFGLSVVALLPSGGSEREWGGRLLAPIVVPLGVAAAAGLVRRLRGRSWEQQAAVIAALVVLAAFPASQGLKTIRDFRSANEQIASEIRRVSTDVVVIDNPRLIRTPIFSWRLNDEVEWFTSYGQTPDLLAALVDAGADQVTILPDPTRPTLNIAPYAVGEKVDSALLESRGIPVFRLTAPAAEAADL